MSELRSSAGESLEFEVGPVERDEPAKAIASSAGVAVTTTENHGYSAGDYVRVQGHLGNPINGVWAVSTVTSPTTFELSGAASGWSGGQTGECVRQAPIDLTLADTEMFFTAKERLTDLDADAFVAKTSTASGGITLNSPSSSRKNLATVSIDPADTDDCDGADFYFDVKLVEPDGRVTRLDHGIWKVGAPVTRA